jgi:O-Antigen ligase
MPVTTSRFSTRIERVSEVLWAIALICLPLTSFPLFSSLSGAIVAPFSLLPFFILLVIWSIPMIIRRGELPKETLPLVLFTLAVIISCAAAYFFFIPGFKGKTVPGQEIRALFTLSVGLSFYIVTVTWIKTTEKLNHTWKYITIGGVLSLLWIGIQAFYILRGAEQYPSWMNLIQSWLAVLSPQYSPRYGRVNGLTYEASWFAHQMVMLYLPLWLAASYHKTSAFAFRIFHISLENILLVFGMGAFFLSSPRIGLVSLLLMIFYLFIRINLSIHHRIVEYLSMRRFFLQHAASQARKSWIQVLTSLSIIFVYVLVLIGVFFFAAQRDWRLNILVNDPPTLKEMAGLLTLDQNTILSLSHRFIFLERAVYWLNGWNVFNQYPWLGVGLGNTGFFFPKLAPAIGWATFEIRNVLYYLTQLPNVKSFWFRILAETGLIGFSIFISWLYVLFQSSRFSQNNRNRTIKTFGMAGQLALLAFIGEGLSIDSFAMPYLWVMAGLIAAIAMIYRHEILGTT